MSRTIRPPHLSIVCRTILFIASVTDIFRIPLVIGIIKTVRRRFRPS
jgi:hypothetical protein